MHQAITWATIDSSSVMSCGIHAKAVSQEMFKISTTKMYFKIIHLEF